MSAQGLNLELQEVRVAPAGRMNYTRYCLRRKAVWVSAAQTRDLTLNAGCVGFLSDVEVVAKSHSNLLNARTPEKMINDRSGFRLNRQHCIPRSRSIDGDEKPAVWATIDRVQLG